MKQRSMVGENLLFLLGRLHEQTEGKFQMLIIVESMVNMDYLV
jgi:hypothetical protein